MQNHQALRFFFHLLSRARTVRWMLEECGANCTSVPLEFGPSLKAPADLALHPMGQVPALQHGETVITETATALAYLADLDPERQLAPAIGRAERGSDCRWLFFVAAPVEGITLAQSEGWLARQAPQQALSAGNGRLEDVSRTRQLAAQGKTGVCGAHCTAAGIYLASYLAWACECGELPRLPEFENDHQPLRQRPAVLRAEQIDGPVAAALAATAEAPAFRAPEPA
jgi:glutathione S-transferase